MSAFDDAVAACKAANARMPPHLAAWLVSRQVQGRTWDQTQLGQALIDLMGGPGPEPLASMVTRMVHPNVEHRFPVDGQELREQLEEFVKASGRPAGPPQVNMFLSSVATMPKPKDSGEWLTGGAQLDASGRLSDPDGERSPPPPAVFEPPKMSDSELQLARPLRQPAKEWIEAGPYRNDPGKGVNRGLIAVIVLGLVAIGVVVTFMLFPTLQRKLPLPTTSARALLVTSSPEGATVLIEGQSVGQTPFAGDNRWRGRAKLELRLEGYEPFRDTFEGGKDQSVAATLKKKK